MNIFCHNLMILQPQSIDNTQLCTGLSPLEAAKDKDSYKDEDDREAKIEIVKLLEAAQSGGLQ